jgi:hypothetical protein
MESPVRAGGGTAAFPSLPATESSMPSPGAKKPLGPRAVASNPLGGHAYKVTMGLYSIVSHGDPDAKHASHSEPAPPHSTESVVDANDGRLSSKLAGIHKRLTGDMPIWELVLYEIVRQVPRLPASLRTSPVGTQLHACVCIIVVVVVVVAPDLGRAGWCWCSRLF